MSRYVVKSPIFFCTNHGAMGFGNAIEWPIHLGEEAPGAAFGSHLGTWTFRFWGWWLPPEMIGWADVTGRWRWNSQSFLWLKQIKSGRAAAAIKWTGCEWPGAKRSCEWGFPADNAEKYYWHKSSGSTTSFAFQCQRSKRGHQYKIQRAHYEVVKWCFSSVITLWPCGRTVIMCKIHQQTSMEIFGAVPWGPKMMISSSLPRC